MHWVPVEWYKQNKLKPVFKIKRKNLTLVTQAARLDCCCLQCLLQCRPMRDARRWRFASHHDRHAWPRLARLRISREISICICVSSSEWARWWAHWSSRWLHLNLRPILSLLLRWSGCQSCRTRMQLFASALLATLAKWYRPRCLRNASGLVDRLSGRP